MTTPVIPPNGTHPNQPQTPTNPTQPNTEANAELARLEGLKKEIEAKQAALSKRERTFGVEATKHAEERKTWGEKLKAIDKYERAVKDAQINPEALAKTVWGDNWWDKLTEHRLNGGASSAAAVTSEIEKVREESRAEIEKLKAELETQSKTRAEAEEKAAISNEVSRLGKHFASNEKDYKALKLWFQTPEQIGNVLFQRAKWEYENNGGKEFSDKELATLVEGELRSRAKAILEEEKPQGTQSAVESTKSAGERRTLNNDLTASTPADKPKRRTEAQRMEDTLRRYTEGRAKV